MENEKQLPISGNSMYPTLRGLDIITVSPYNGREVKCGDIIVYISPITSNIKIAHRVIRISPDGIITRGDNLKVNDSWIVPNGAVIGKVESVRRNRKLFKAKNGPVGQIIGYSHYVKLLSLDFIRKRIYVLISPLFISIYRFLSRSGIFRIWIPAPWKPRLMSFSKPEGLELRLLMGKRKVAVHTPFSKRWIIKKPFKLFIDEKSLPPYPQNQDNDSTQNTGNNADSH
jgi:signal peptidase I